MEKYKIVITEGCTAFDTTVNDRSVTEIVEEEMDEIIDYLLAQVREAYNRHELCFDDIVKLFQPDDWEHDPEQCSSCFDTVSKTTWNI